MSTSSTACRRARRSTSPRRRRSRASTPRHRHQRLRRHRRRRRGDRHRRRAAQAGHEPRRPDRHQRQGCRHGRRGDQGALPGRLRHHRHQSARRDGVGACARPAACRRNASSAWPACWTAPVSAISSPGARRLGRGRHRLRARRPRRHDGAADPLFDRRRHPAARPGQDGLDDAGAARPDRRSAPATAAPRSSAC